ncbi:MAG: hypothetical protein O7B29_05875 [Deltaproteobacteria bacterium]|nr:hypothetical protein [Deltaproteobacteria bacterium]
MRVLGTVLGALLLCLSVAFGTGGVALRSHADPSPVIPAALELGDEESLEAGLPADQGVCRAPEPIQRRMTLPFPKPREGDVMFTLNTRGYNYTRPGQPYLPVPEGVAPANIKRR